MGIFRSIIQRGASIIQNVTKRGQSAGKQSSKQPAQTPATKETTEKPASDCSDKVKGQVKAMQSEIPDAAKVKGQDVTSSPTSPTPTGNSNSSGSYQPARERAPWQPDSSSSKGRSR